MTTPKHAQPADDPRKDDWRRADPRLQLAYDESWKAIGAQSNHVDGIKTRTAAALTAAGVVLALTTSSLFPKIGATAWDWVAVGVFGVLLIISVEVMRPREWVFVRSPRTFDQFWTGETQLTLDQMLSDMYDDAVGYYEANRDKIRRLELAYLLVVVALGLLIVAVSVALIRR